MIEDRIVKIEAGDFDKYGRILARIYTYCNQKELCINDFLIENELAKFYSGKTKSEFTSGDYDDFIERHEDKKWPKTIDYPN